MTVFRYNFVLIMYFCVHAMVLLYRTWCIHSDLHISTWLMWFLSIVYIEIHSDAIAIFSDCTWSVSHSNSVHCLTIYSNFSEYNVLLWLAWFRKEYTFLLWFSYSCFLITYFKHIELWRMLVRGFMFFCPALVSLTNIIRDLF